MQYYTKLDIISEEGHYQAMNPPRNVSWSHEERSIGKEVFLCCHKNLPKV
jgi:hypothetical protein